MKKLFSICLMCLMALAAQAQDTPTRRLQVKTLPDSVFVFWVSYSVRTMSPDGYYISQTYGWRSDTIAIDLQIPVGTEVSINVNNTAVNYAYHGSTMGDYQLVDWKENGEVTESVRLGSNSSTSYFKYVMPDYDVELVGTFEYNPAPPKDQPGQNGWYPETGTLVLDYSSLMYTTAFPTGFTRDDYDKVLRVIFGSWCTNISPSQLTDFPNCTFADYSRTAIEKCTSYSDHWYNTAVNEMVLPATMKEITGSNFREISLTTLTCYALTPPTMTPYYQTTWNSATSSYITDTIMPFALCPDMVVRVPADVVPLYQRADYWKNFTILPIDEDYVNLTVNLMATPDERKLSQYKNMHLELTSNHTGVVRSMLVNGRNSYEFRYLPTNTSYDLVLRSQTGAEVATYENVFLGEENKTLTFDYLKTPRKLTLSLTAEGKAVEGQLYTNTWLNDKKAYLGRGPELTNVFEGQKVSFFVELSRELAMQYMQPDTVVFVVGEQPDDIVVELQKLPMTDVTFNIVDSRTRQGISDATVKVVQLLFNGETGTMQELTADADGQARGQVISTMSNIIVNSASYGSSTFYANLNDSTEFTVKMLQADGTTITINWSYTAAVFPEEATVTTPDYPDRDMMRLTFRNYSTWENITEYRNQAPRYTLYETLPEGTNIYVTGTSLKDNVNDVYGYGTVDSLGQVTVDMNVMQRATMRVSYTTCDGLNPAIMLFRNGSINLVRKQPFGATNSYIDFTELQSGQYQVVAMTQGEAYDGITNTDQLKKLTEGIDYVSQTVNINDGTNERINFGRIPLTTNTLTSLLASRRAYFKQRQVSVGEYATVNVTTTFKPGLTGYPKDVKLVFEIPQNCKFVAGSVLKGKTKAAYELSSYPSRLTVAWDDIETDSIVRFCVIPQQAGEYLPAASLTYTLDGEEHVDPLQTTKLSCVSAIINVPEVINTPRFKVSGKSAASIDAYHSRAKKAVTSGIKLVSVYIPPQYNVDILDGDVVIGNANTNSNGEWDAWVTLPNPTSLSKHSIWARVNRNNTSYETERRELTYDPNAVVPKTLTMSFFNHHPAHLENTTVLFDYINDRALPKHYGFSNQEGYNTDFTFEVDLSTNDTTKVYACALYIHTMGPDAEERITMCHYNARKDRWIAYEKFNTRSLPYDVYVEPFYYHDNIGSRREMDLPLDWYDSLFNKEGGAMGELQGELGDLIKQGESAYNNGQEDAIPSDAIDQKLQQWMHLNGLDEREVEDTGQTIEELIAAVDALWSSVGPIADYFADISQYAQAINELGAIAEGISTSTTAGMDAASLKEQGYHENHLDDGSTIFVSVTEDGGWDFVNLERNLHITVNGESAARMGVSSLMRSEESWVKGLEKMGEYLDKFQDYVGKIAEICESSITKFNYWIYMAEDTSVKLGKQLANPNLSKFQRWWIESKLSLNLTKTSGLEKVRSFCTKFKVGNAVGSLASLYSLISTYMKFRDNGRKLNAIKNGIPSPCPDDQANANKLRNDINSFGNWCVPYMIAAISSDVVALVAATGCFAALIPTGGSSVVPLGVSLAKIGLTMAANYIYEDRMEAAIEVFSFRKSELVCHKKDPNCKERGDCPKCTENCDDYPKGPKGPKGPTTTGDLDPSGYVYEGVASNRVEGATATVYYRTTEKDMYGDNVEKIVMWDAEAFDQINPQQTDHNGEYGWMVPAGEWQVKYEKEGYQTAYSEWLPVPPPQLDVNQELRQYSQPVITDVKATQEGVTVSFDKYMRPVTLTTDNISITRNGTLIGGSIEMVNSEESEGQTYANRVRFVPEEKLPVGQTLLLTVSGDVESYTKVAMGETFSQEFDIKEAVEQIVADSAVNVIYDQPCTFTINALPAKAAAGKKVSVNLLSDIIASVQETEVTFDTNGQATITVVGDAHGTTAIELTLADDADVKALVMVNVKDETDFIVPLPSANYLTETQLYYGTEIELTCELPEAVIYYTLDGSCPCEQESNHVFRYNGPITATADMTLKAIAVAKGYTDSDINELHYGVVTGSNSLHLSKGYNWVSHSNAAALPLTALGTGTEQATDESGASVNMLQPATAYVVRNSVSHDAVIEGFAWNARQNGMLLNEGWNWLPYPLTTTLTLAEALAYVQPQNGDVVVGEEGFAVCYSTYYSDPAWYGTLQKLTPGHAYRYLTNSERLFVLNTNVDESEANNLKPFERFRWYDAHGWPNRMPVLARLKDQNGNQIRYNLDHYQVMAFSGDDCRGNGYWITANNYYCFINVLGDDSETVRFVIHDTWADKSYDAMLTLPFTSDLQGTFNEPVWLQLGDEVSGIDGIETERSATAPTYTLEGVKVKTDGQLRKGVYVGNGRKIVVK